MQDWDALKYFLINLGLHNLVLVLLAAGLGLLLGRFLWARSAQGLITLRERVSAEGERAREAERELEEAEEKFRELRAQLESGEGGAMVINEPGLEEELAALRERALEADATLERMMIANGALEVVVKELEVRNAGLEESAATGGEYDAAELAGLRAEIEVLRRESEEVREERDRGAAEVAELRGELEASEEAGKAKNIKAKQDGAQKERVAALEMELLAARTERRQVEEASGVLRKELYGMRHQLEGFEKRAHLEKELDAALRDAEQRVTRLQAEVAGSRRRREEAMRGEAGKREFALEEKKDLEGLVDEKARDEKPVFVVDSEAEEAEVVKLSVEDEVDEDDFADDEEAEDEAEDDLTRLKGVGVVLAKRLNEAGVTSFRQIAEWTEGEVKEISKKLSLRKRVVQGDWRGQARALHKEMHGEDL